MNFPLFPEEASSLASQVDHLTLAWLGVSLFFSLLIAGLILYFFVHYRRRSQGEVGSTKHVNTLPLELLWSVIPLIIALGMFAWGAKVFFVAFRPPANAVEYWVTGRQWMWKIQHPEGVREINTLHVPVGQPVKLTMTSEDVIHSFYLPSFRVKSDVLPGRYTTVWFTPTKVGTYHLFCAEYCGAEHSLMKGSVIVLPPEEYERWLETGKTGPTMQASGAVDQRPVGGDRFGSHDFGPPAQVIVAAGRGAPIVPAGNHRFRVVTLHVPLAVPQALRHGLAAQFEPFPAASNLRHHQGPADLAERGVVTR